MKCVVLVIVRDWFGEGRGWANNVSFGLLGGDRVMNVINEWVLEG